MLDAISCPTASFCAAVDADGDVVTYNGSSWSSATSVDGTKVLDAVSCPTTSFCAAVDADGNAVTYNGSSWSSATSIDGTTALNGVSCSSATFCVADDTGGNVLTYDGTSWTSANISDGSNILDAVSCPSSSFCAAVDADGKVLLDTGTSWASATSIDGTKTLSSVSCPTASFCMAVDTAGNAVKGSATTATAQLTWDTNGSLPEVLYDGTNDYVYGPTGEPVEQVNVTTSAPAANPLFLTYTPSDSSWLVTNASGQQVSYYRYDAYGTLSLGTPTSPFGYAGQYADTSSSPSGFDDMRARQYQAETGQFTTRDPEFELTDEAYGYAGDDPVNGSDPTGLWCILGHNPNGGCRGSGVVVSTWHDTAQAWDCVTAACYSTKQGAANLVAGAHNSLNYIAGLPAVDVPYLCTDADAYALGGQLPYIAAFAGVPGISESEAIEAASADAAEGEGASSVAGGGPKPSPNFIEPTNPPQYPPTDLPPGYSVRAMAPTEQYPDGYWVETNEGGQQIDPSTGKPPSNVSRAMARAMTHVPFPPGG